MGKSDIGNNCKLHKARVQLPQPTYRIVSTDSSNYDSEQSDTNKANWRGEFSVSTRDVI